MPLDICVSAALKRRTELRGTVEEQRTLTEGDTVGRSLLPVPGAAVIGYPFIVLEAVNALRLGEADLYHAVFGHGLRHTELRRKLFDYAHDVGGRPVPSRIVVQLLYRVIRPGLLHEDIGGKLRGVELHPLQRTVGL